MADIDPFRYGVLHQKVDDYQRKLDDMERKMDYIESDLKKLVLMAERSKGSLWALMGAASVAGGVATWITDILFKR